MKNHKRKIVVVQALLLAVLGAVAQGTEPTDAIALVPKPLEVRRDMGEFPLNADTSIVVEANSPAAMDTAKQLQARLRASTGLDLKVATLAAAETPRGAIGLACSPEAALGSEGYRLEVTPERITIIGGGPAGMFYGTQTLLQLLPPEVFSPTKVARPAGWAVPAVHIKDRPRFAWRGLLLGSSRHFFTKQEVKNFLDVMAQQKLNTLQWHLTDGHGWRLEIKRYPKLTAVGAWRDGIDFGLDPKASTAYGPDGRYGGFYRQDDIREIVAYAKQRYITIVPEIEMPGHSGAAVRAYPQLGCVPGAEEDCAGNEETYTFLQNVLTEVMDLFPSQYIHIGGDEVDKGHWSRCPKCQARKKAEGLKNEHELQSYFIRRIEKFINAKGRRMVGWSEIREGGIAPNAVLTDWIGGAAESAREGHDVVMTPHGYCYFDHYQATTGEPGAWGGFLPLSKVYSLEPVPGGLTAAEAKHILGAQGNLWTEHIPNYRHLQYMAYPRACALAEVTWTAKDLKNWPNFRQRLETHLQRFVAQGANFRRLDKPVATGIREITVNRETPKGKLYFSFFSLAFYMDRFWGHGTPLIGIKRMAAVAHANGIPVTWLVDSRSAEAAKDLFTEYHEKYGDDVALMLPGYDADTARAGGDKTWFRSLSYPQMKALLAKEAAAIRRSLPWAKLEILGACHRTNTMVRAAEDLGFKALWGHCWEQSYTDDISDRGTPWGYYYASRDCYKAPAQYPDGLVGVEWTARDLNKAFHTGNPIAYSTDPNEVIRARPQLCDHRQIDYWKRLVGEYQANTQWNAVVPLTMEQESHEMENSEKVRVYSPQDIDNSADVLDEFFKYMKSTGAEIVPAEKAVAAYREAHRSTPPTYALVHDVTPTLAAKKDKDLFIYFDANGQLFFDRGKTDPVVIRDYLTAHDPYTHDFARVANVPAARISQTRDASGVTFDCTVTAAGPLPYGLAFWGDYTGQTIRVSAPAVTKVLDGELAYVGVVLKPGENRIKVTISPRARK
jgi:N-acetyl-beta-hexosaminidase